MPVTIKCHVCNKNIRQQYMFAEGTKRFHISCHYGRPTIGYVLSTYKCLICRLEVKDIGHKGMVATVITQSEAKLGNRFYPLESWIQKSWAHVIAFHWSCLKPFRTQEGAAIIWLKQYEY